MLEPHLHPRSQPLESAQTPGANAPTLSDQAQGIANAEPEQLHRTTSMVAPNAGHSVITQVVRQIHLYIVSEQWFQSFNFSDAVPIKVVSASAKLCFTKGNDTPSNQVAACAGKRSNQAVPQSSAESLMGRTGRIFMIDENAGKGTGYERTGFEILTLL